MQAFGSAGHVPLVLPLPPLLPCWPQSEKHVEELSPFVVSHCPLPQTALLLLLLPPSPQSVGQYPISAVAHVPSPHTLPEVLSSPPMSSSPGPGDSAQATANASAIDRAQKIPDLVLIIGANRITDCLSAIKDKMSAARAKRDQPLSAPYTDCASLRANAALNAACSGRTKPGSSSRIRSA